MTAGSRRPPVPAAALSAESVHRTEDVATWAERAAQLWQLLEDIKCQSEMWPEASGVEFRRAAMQIIEQRGASLWRSQMPIPAVTRATVLPRLKRGRNGWG